MSAVDRVEYDEFGLFHENAAEFAIPYEHPPVVRRESVEMDDGRRISAMVWGSADPELVFLHGGAQNAHTWDTVALALDRPILAIDLPSHGHSDAGRNGTLDVSENAKDVAAVIRALAPDARGVIGMSLGGETTLALADQFPELVRAVVLVDITPGVTHPKSKMISDFINGPESFADFDEIVARTIHYNPTRTVSSLRRGILHNAVQRDDGSWVWRYARFRASEPERDQSGPNFGFLWDAVSRIQVPLMLARGMQAQTDVDDDDEAELLRRCPTARVEHVEEAGHSLQGDTPLELARLLEDFIP